AVDDAVGQERAAARREEVALVAAEREEGEAVAAVLADESLRVPALRRGLARPQGERPEPQVERPRREREREQAERLLDPLRERHPVGDPKRREHAEGGESASTRAASGTPGGRIARTRSKRSANSGVSADTTPTTPAAAAPRPRSAGALRRRKRTASG